MTKSGYVLVRARSHPKAKYGGRVLEHVLIAEKALGHYLSGKAEVHHVNEIKGDNRPENLVICQDRAYHQFLHIRAESVRQLGHPNGRKCKYCRKWDVVESLRTYSRTGWMHIACNRLFQRKQKQGTEWRVLPGRAEFDQAVKEVLHAHRDAHRV